MRHSFDCIVVGAGSAGAALAARLSEDPATRVLLLEAGRDLRPADVPANMRSANHMNVFLDPAFVWTSLCGRLTELQEPTFLPRGKCVGGTSAINGQIAIRGTPEDFDGWEAQGCAGWSYADVLPYFRTLEDDLDFPTASYHGSGGPIPVRRAPRAQWGTVDRALAAAATALGYPWADDHNAPGSTGVSPYAVNNRGADRVSCLGAYVEPARGRSNLEIRGDTLVDRVLMEGTRAVGVRVGTAGGWEEVAGQTIVVAAGTIHSPAMLMRSGIGPRDQLEQVGIAVVADLPVGENLLDHPFLPGILHLRPEARAATVDERITNCCVRYASGIAGGPNDMMLFSWNQLFGDVVRELGFIGVSVMQAFSRGHVTLASPDPAIDPRVEFRLLSDERDLRRMVDGLHRLREVTQHPAVTAIADRVDLGLSGTPLDDALAAPNLEPLVLQACMSYGHAAGTCRMGAADDPRAVVDPRCAVRGVERLRVVDCSVMPAIVRANTHLTAVMIAEKIAADLSRQPRREAA